LFTGRKVVGIATGNNTASIDDVRDYFSPMDIEVFSVPNNPRIREGATFTKLLEYVQDRDGITFYCHAKGSRHVNFTENTIVRQWTEAMYLACLNDIARVLTDLCGHCMTGPFKRYGMFKTSGNHRWHYSGSFYWFRNSDVFARNWTKLDRQFFAVESWPGLMFHPSETSCLFVDNAGDLYKQEYWDSSVRNELEKLNALVSHQEI
jgi:hypothetical protein